MSQKSKSSRLFVKSEPIGKPSEFRSKLVDGVLAGSVLVLLELLLILLIKPVQLVFSNPGLLVYALILLSVSVVCLERSLHSMLSEWVQAWGGILGGLTAWIMVELNSGLGGQTLTSETGMLNLMLVFLVASVLWRKIAPLGLRYYLMALLLSWAGHSGLSSLAFFTTSVEPRLAFLYSAAGFLAVGVMAIALAYILLRSRTQLERLNAAMAIWFTAMIMIYVFRGGPG
jgi:hypothetical protein